MNIIDILLAIPLGYFIWKGFKRGIIYEISVFLGIIAGCYISIRFAKLVADILPFDGEGTMLIAFFILFVGVIFLARILGKAVENAVKMVHAGFLNKALGATFGFLKVVCVASVLINYILLLDARQELITPKLQEESLLFNPVHKVGNKLTGQLRDYTEQMRVKRSAQSEEESSKSK